MFTCTLLDNNEAFAGLDLNLPPENKKVAKTVHFDIVDLDISHAIQAIENKKVTKTVHFDIVDLGISEAVQAIENKKVAKTVYVLIAGCPGRRINGEINNIASQTPST